MVELSVIVTILFTGMFARIYTHPNLSVDGQVSERAGGRASEYHLGLCCPVASCMFSLFLASWETSLPFSPNHTHSLTHTHSHNEHTAH